MKNKKIILCIIATFLLFFFIIIYGILETYWIEEKIFKIESKEIPSKFDEFKIVFISDIHCSNLYSPSRLKKLVKRINNYRPDLIILGGDYVTNSRKYIKPCFNELKNLKPKLKTIGVLGNHDYKNKNDIYLPYLEENMKKAQIEVLRNKTIEIRIKKDKIKIGGVEDFWRGIPDIKKVLKGVKKQDFFILITHNPDFIETLTKEELKYIDLILSAHTHGGQITFFKIWAPYLPSDYGQKFLTNFLYKENVPVIITNGIGTIYLPIRICARPQIDIIILKSKIN